MAVPDEADVIRVRRALKAEPAAWRAASRSGQTAAARWHVELADGSRAFVKVGATLESVAWVRDEHLIYTKMRGSDFMPEMLGWHDDGERPVLVLEDLSDGHWPPPWESAHIAAVLEGLSRIHQTEPPEEIIAIDSTALSLRGVWRDLAEDPEPFLALGLCDRDWLRAAIPIMEEASLRADIEGDSLLHMDVRSDNLCIRGGRAIFVDWNWACIGSPLFEIACWLPSLHAEGGPAPEEMLSLDTPGLTEMAALLAGYLCSHAGRPPIPDAPHVRQMQLMQARTALPWAARSLGLEPPF